MYFINFLCTYIGIKFMIFICFIVTNFLYTQIVDKVNIITQKNDL